MIQRLAAAQALTQLTGKPNTQGGSAAQTSCSCTQTKHNRARTTDRVSEIIPSLLDRHLFTFNCLEWPTQRLLDVVPQKRMCYFDQQCAPLCSKAVGLDSYRHRPFQHPLSPAKLTHTHKSRKHTTGKSGSTQFFFSPLLLQNLVSIFCNEAQLHPTRVMPKSVERVVRYSASCLQDVLRVWWWWEEELCIRTRPS